MFKIQTLNSIDPLGLRQLPANLYHVAENEPNPDGILVRSAIIKEESLPANLKIVARAGVGVNNIPIQKLTQLGIPVLNTPGANANAVKELVIAGMLLACRNLCQAWDYARHLTGDNKGINEQVEQGKKQFAGFELPGKTLGIIGLGNVGVKVANAAIALGMRVIGYDPTITVQRAWELSANVEEMRNLESLITQADFISLHIPLTPETKSLIEDTRLRLAKKGMILLNFSREAIVDKAALLSALNDKHIAAYVCDFPCADLKNHPQVICLPHLGASTKEAEETCAIMAVKQLRSYLESGTIINSVNFPSAEMSFNKGVRLAIANANIPNMVAQISTKLATAHLNIIDLLNKSRGEIAYTLVDVDEEINDSLLQELKGISGVIQVRLITGLPTGA